MILHNLVFVETKMALEDGEIVTSLNRKYLKTESSFICLHQFSRKFGMGDATIKFELLSGAWCKLHVDSMKVLSITACLDRRRQYKMVCCTVTNDHEVASVLLQIARGDFYGCVFASKEDEAHRVRLPTLFDMVLDMKRVKRVELSWHDTQ